MKIKMCHVFLFAAMGGAWMLFGTPLQAEMSGSEKALAIQSEDPSLQWGGCPDTVFKEPGCQIAVVHGNPGQNNADVFLKVPGKYKIPSHWHTSPERMILVSGQMEVTYEGQEKAVLKPGMYAYGPAKIPHYGACVSSKPCILFIAFESPIDAYPTGQ